jgi:predicted DNA-binding transcriptional regulator YafY
MHRIHQLIKREATGSADEFAGRFKLKKRQLYYLLDEFKDYGAEIRYSRIRNTYYYDNDFEVKVVVSTHPLMDSERK